MIINDEIISNIYLNLFVNTIFYTLILMIFPVILLAILSLIKIKKETNNNNSLIYMYSFSTGMFLMIGAFGFLREGYNIAQIFTHDPSTGISKEIYRMLVIVGIVGISSLVGFSLVIGGKYLFIKKSKIDLHSEHHNHDHSDHLVSFKDIDNPKAAWLAILMLLSHRIIDGLFIGYSISRIILTKNTFSSSLILLITFTIHMIFEMIIVYFRQIQYGEKKKKAILYNFLTFLLIIPFILIGAFTGVALSQNSLQWIQSGLLIMGGSIIIFTAVFELIPEFIHIKNKDTKTLYKTLIIFSLSIVLTIMILSFHTHIR
ncbi:ZIP family metal transporter [Metamycoplasma canadense]|uniref:ZIP Zinc transporter n=1 Tax=Metamycoplasma canadense TaxID=29554 RepID=A0A077L674_9BACT|nr:ZIP family metal transporter [Metamycoplasma canadense]BAP39795.1 hypothetical protein MCAN360_0776 [Metamycoplasma canadense]